MKAAANAAEHEVRWGSGDPQTRRQNNTRLDEVKSAALDLFATHGYHGTTMVMIAETIGIRAPSLYKHVASKQDLLRDVMFATMEHLIRDHDAAVGAITDPMERLRRATEAHVRYHARHQVEAFVGNSEIRSLEADNRAQLLRLRADYETRFRKLIVEADAAGRCSVESTKIASFAILDLGMGVAAWYRSRGEFTEDQIVNQYGAMVLKLLGASPA